MRNPRSKQRRQPPPSPDLPPGPLPPQLLHRQQLHLRPQQSPQAFPWLLPVLNRQFVREQSRRSCNGPRRHPVPLRLPLVFRIPRLRALLPRYRLLPRLRLLQFNGPAQRLRNILLLLTDPRQPAALEHPLLNPVLRPAKASVLLADIQDPARLNGPAHHPDIVLPVRKALLVPVVRRCGRRSVRAVGPANPWAEDPAAPPGKPRKRSRASLFTCASLRPAPSLQLKSDLPKASASCIQYALALVPPSAAVCLMPSLPRRRWFASRAQ